MGCMMSIFRSTKARSISKVRRRIYYPFAICAAVFGVVAVTKNDLGETSKISLLFPQLHFKSLTASPHLHTCLKASTSRMLLRLDSIDRHAEDCPTSTRIRKGTICWAPLRSGTCRCYRSRQYFPLSCGWYYRWEVAMLDSILYIFLDGLGSRSS